MRTAEHNLLSRENGMIPRSPIALVIFPRYGYLGNLLSHRHPGLEGYVRHELT